MKVFSTRTHGFLDYATAGTLVALPRLLGWSSKVTNTLTVAAIGLTAASLLTTYELGASKVLPMRGHLALDALSGAAFLGAPLVFSNEKRDILGTLVGLGLFELFAAFTTEPAPSWDERAEQFGEALHDRVVGD